ncbi:Transposon TX1 uncharacterized protein [Sesamum angolense]|uniref:Transposon TX1 uncharacterized protein n=1 Tax=Sesamum angolense TaxID=2727404 RepID=A0AAE1VYK7_9LAMI|nr:Transposon TX1 uncharacterized protein [Sesamum angolense]
MKGDLSANVKLAGEFLEVSQRLLQEDRHDPLLLHLEHYCRLVFLKVVKIEQVMLQQRAKIQWMKGGDQCSRVFFRKVAIRRANKRIFQISDEAEDRAPGPDGYSSGFFKAAWPVVGEEITAAVMDFFTTGRLLKQVNATLITLIPKVSAPSLVADFRPISCCNVIYKIITKILVIRIRGYKQCRLPPRCALKVDLRKAYDTVEWEFLMATLQLFGFPSTFNRWIEECVTSPHFSLYLNGEDGGFTYHWQCKELGLFQLSFADDLILLCKAEVRSVDLFRRGLDPFASLSGLHTNPQKSHLILSKAANGVRSSLLETLGFQEGRLPLRKIDARMRGWDGVGLSFAGRVQLIKSVLLAFEVYWAMAFLLPKGVIKGIVKRIRTFLWKGNSSSGYPKVAWEKFIKHEKESIWVEWIAHYRLRDASIWTVNAKRGAWSWRKMLELRGTLLPHIQLKIGTGESFSLWHDPWHNLGPLILRFPRGPQLTGTTPMATLSEVIEDNMWSWPLIRTLHIWRSSKTFHPFTLVVMQSLGILMAVNSQMQQPITYSGRQDLR